MIKFYYAPWSRALATRWLLEELGVEYEPVQVDIRAEGGAPEDYRAIQPNKKVPAIEHDGTVITERAAIAIYLADAFPEAGLAPAVGDLLRGPYLSFVVYNDSVFDPCVAARAHGLSYVSNDYSFGLFDDMMANIERHLSNCEYLVGDRFTAADIQLGASLAFTMDALKVVPRLPAFQAYTARVTSRPAYRRVKEWDDREAMALPYFQKMFGKAAQG